MPDEFTIAVDSGSSVTSVRLAGSLGLVGAAKLRTVLHKIVADQPSAVVIDMAGVVVVDDLSVLVFAAGWQADLRRGTVLLLYGASGETTRAIERMGVDRQILLCRDRAEALRRVTDSPDTRRATERIPPVPESAGLARRIVGEVCARWEITAVLEAAEVVVTELVTNAVQHGIPPVELSLARRGRYLHIEVRDGSPTMPRRMTVSEPSEHGRGLLVIEAFSTAWGTSPRANGKVVWATIRASPR
jgi:anti-anti-sigma regulatory factor/anti-sigma regulatory factor (Ser/Thr protein kinase)